MLHTYVPPGVNCTPTGVGNLRESPEDLSDYLESWIICGTVNFSLDKGLQS